jgi:hypothetical protein
MIDMELLINIGAGNTDFRCEGGHLVGFNLETMLHYPYCLCFNMDLKGRSVKSYKRCPDCIKAESAAVKLREADTELKELKQKMEVF